MAEDPESAAPEPPRRPRQSLGWLQQILPAVGLALLTVSFARLLGSAPWTLPGWSWLGGPSFHGGVAVVLDPGHGGGDSGAVAQGVVEKDLNLDVARRVAAALRAKGVTVRLTREDDRFVPLAGRVSMANALPGAIFVSIHFNDAPGSGRAAAQASGIETYFSDSRETGPASPWVWASLSSGKSSSSMDCVHESQRLADSIQGALVLGTTATDRGIKERALYVTRRVLAPAVLVEGGFVSHPAEARQLGDPAYRQRLAELIAAGILKYLAVQTRPAMASR